MTGGDHAAARCKWAAWVNFGDAVCLGTVGIGCSAALCSHVTFNAGARVNPWIFKQDTPYRFQAKHQTYYAGARYWYRKVYSGWWTGAFMQFQEYNCGGFFSSETEEGNAYGLALAGGYSLVLCRHLNLDLGIGMWGGVTEFSEYSCPRCGRVISSGIKPFLRPNELIVSLVWIF